MAWVEKHGEGFRVRFRLDDGSVFSEPGFESESDAINRVADIESDQRRGRFVDPRLAQTTVGTWVKQWVESLDVTDITRSTYDSHLRNHILPRFGDTALGDLSRLMIKR